MPVLRACSATRSPSPTTAVATDTWLVVTANGLGAGETVTLDASAETNGHIGFTGGAGNDFAIGGGVLGYAARRRRRRLSRRPRVRRHADRRRRQRDLCGGPCGRRRRRNPRQRQRDRHGPERDRPQSLAEANVENLTLTGAAVFGAGNGLANIIIGNGANNRLLGQGGNDRLDGGAGADILDGGARRRRYMSSTMPATPSSSWPAEAPTRCFSSVSHMLADTVENLTLTGAGRDQRHRQHLPEHHHRQRRGQHVSTAAPAPTP